MIHARRLTLASADASGQTRLGDNDPQWPTHRHRERKSASAEPVGRALSALAAGVVAK